MEKLTISGNQDACLKKIENFKMFVADNGFTANQLRAAYNNILGIGGGEDLDESVKKIQDVMNEILEMQLPLNHLADIVNAQQEKEDALPNLIRFVDGLNIGVLDKKTLKFAAAGRKSGTIQCHIENDLIADMAIKETKSLSEVSALSVAMLSAIKEIISMIPAGKKCEFTFIED